MRRSASAAVRPLVKRSRTSVTGAARGARSSVVSIALTDADACRRLSVAVVATSERLAMVATSNAPPAGRSVSSEKLDAACASGSTAVVATSSTDAMTVAVAASCGPIHGRCSAAPHTGSEVSERAAEVSAVRAGTISAAAAGSVRESPRLAAARWASATWPYASAPRTPIHAAPATPRIRMAPRTEANTMPAVRSRR